MKDLFADQPNVVQTLKPEDAPTSFRVVPTKAELVDSIGGRFTDKPGVYRVAYAKEGIDKLVKKSNQRSRLFLLFAGIMVMSAVLLIGTTIRLAIHARQREVAVMKLVGATNWFIRVPFMLEGMIQGVLGALVAFGFVYSLRNVLSHVVHNNPLFKQLIVTSGEVIGTGVFIMVVGALVGAVG